MSVEETQQRVSSREFAEWIALNSIEPWVPNYREYQIAGIIAAEIHNSFQMFLKSSSRKFRKPEDYIPDWDTATTPTDIAQEMTDAERAEWLFQKSSAIFMALGGIDVRKQPN